MAQSWPSPPTNKSHRSHNDYPIGIICALAIEMAAVVAMLDEAHPRLPKVKGDDNSYTLGRMGIHNVVIACLPAGITGTNSAATVAKDMRRTFPIKIGLMVGIGGGVWSQKHDIRLGDIVVSQPDGTHGGVIQWDFGKLEAGGEFKRTGSLDKPPRVLLQALQDIKVKQMTQPNELSQYLADIAHRNSGANVQFGYPYGTHDELFQATYDHIGGDTCESCDPRYKIERTPRSSSAPHVHYGTIASGNKVMKHGLSREQVASIEHILCFEMEAAGLMDSFPCLVIRGICDYADSHKNKVWQPYASAAAAAFTKDYLSVIDKQDINELASAELSYKVPFNLEGVPRANKFVDRPEEMEKLKMGLLPEASPRQKVFALHGLGGIGKTHLAVAFIRRYHRLFSSVFWLNGNDQTSVKQSIASCARRIPPAQISEDSKKYLVGKGGDLDTVVSEVLHWLALPNNTDWLLVFDNVDREYTKGSSDPLAYDVTQYYPGADHGSILITTRLARFRFSEMSLQVVKVNNSQANSIFRNWCSRNFSDSKSNLLLDQLDGLPLTIAQAGAYLEETGLDLNKYIEYYKKQWKDLMEYQDNQDAQRDYYHNGSIWTTWTISYTAIRKKDEPTANLLLLWSFFNNKDLWFELLQTAFQNSHFISTESTRWFGDIASSELRFSQAMRTLQNYSMVEVTEKTADSSTYSTHPVVHRWAYHFQSLESHKATSDVALDILSSAASSLHCNQSAKFQRRLLPHAQESARWLLANYSSVDESIYTLRRLTKLGDFLVQWKLDAPERIYKHILNNQMAQFGLNHLDTLRTVGNLAVLYTKQGKLDEAEYMFYRALEGKEAQLGPNHLDTLQTVGSLGFLYLRQDKLDKAERMFYRALEGKEAQLGSDHQDTLRAVRNLGILYKEQGKFDEAERMYRRALDGQEAWLEPDHLDIIQTVNNLGVLYIKQGKLDEAERMCYRALECSEEQLGPDHQDTLQIFGNLGVIYMRQGKLDEAEHMYNRALAGQVTQLGPNHLDTLQTVSNLAVLYTKQGKLDEAEHMFYRALEGKEAQLGPDHQDTLRAVSNLGVFYEE